MLKEELWQLMLKRNPNFETGPIAFKPESLRKFFDLVWDQALKSEPKGSGDPGLDRLRELFGM